VAWPKGLKRRFYGDRMITMRYLCSTPILVAQVCVLISAWWLRTSSKL